MILYLKEIMSAHGINSVTLAEKLKVSKATVSYWINGRVFPDPDKLESIAAALGVEVWELFKDPTKEVASSHAPNCLCPHCGYPLTIRVE